MTVVEADRTGAAGQGKSGTATIARLTAIWERVLQRSPIAAEDSFFNLGGNDALADALFAEIERECGRELPSVTICHASTIAALAAVLERPALPDFPPFIPLRAGSGTPIFVAHGLGGRASFWGLVNKIETTRPIYAIHAKGVDGIQTPFETIEEMAAFYMDAITDFQPQGPYILFGYSFGGLVALEVAQRLTATGRKVALLALIDTYPHPHFLPPGSRLRLMAKRTRRHFVEMKEMTAGGALRYVSDGIAHRLHLSGVVSRFRAALRDGGNSMPEPSRLSFARTTLRMKRCDLAALKKYRPKFYPGTIKFVKPETNAYFPNEPKAVWTPLSARLEVDTVPGDHLGMLLRRFESLAAILTRYLREVP